MAEVIYDASFARRDVKDPQRARHGQPWTSADYKLLRDLYNVDRSLETICDLMQRPADGVLAKLAQIGVIARRQQIGRHYWVRSSGTNISPMSSDRAYTQVLESLNNLSSNLETMITSKAKTIEVKTMIHGVDASTLTDKEIFSEIGKIEHEITKLEAIKAKPQKLVKVIAELEDDIKKLVVYVDSRET